MQNSLQQLKVAQNKFMESKACMEKFTPENEGIQFSAFWYTVHGEILYIAIGCSVAISWKTYLRGASGVSLLLWKQNILIKMKTNYP